MLKKLFFIGILFTNIAYSADIVKEQTVPQQANDKSTATNNDQSSFISSIKGNSHIYTGVILGGSLNVDTTINNSSSAYSAQADLKSPGFVIGFNFMPIRYEAFRFGLGFMHELKRDVDTLTQRVGSGSSTTSNNRTEQVKVSTFSLLAEREIMNGASIFAGGNLNLATFDGNTTTNWDTKTNVGIEVGFAYTYSAFRAELLYKTVSGDADSTAKNSGSGINSTGSYDYNHLVLSLGMIF